MQEAQSHFPPPPQVGLALRFISALLASQWKEAWLCGPTGSCGTNPQAGEEREGTDYLLKHNRVLHNPVVSLFGMEVMELTRRLD